MLKHDRQTASRIRKNLQNALLEERESILATRLTTIDDNDRSALYVVPGICPVPLAEGAVDALLKVRYLLVKAVCLVLGVLGTRECDLGTVRSVGAGLSALSIRVILVLLGLGQSLPEPDLGSALEEQLAMRLSVQAVDGAAEDERRKDGCEHLENEYVAKMPKWPSRCSGSVPSRNRGPHLGHIRRRSLRALAGHLFDRTVRFKSSQRVVCSYAYDPSSTMGSSFTCTCTCTCT